MFNKKQLTLRVDELAAIQYVGSGGVTRSCVHAVSKLLSDRSERVQKACLLTCSSYHGFLFFTEFDSVIAVKDGFTSGYGGEGPRGLASALMLLRQHNIEIEEYLIDSDFHKRLHYSCLLQVDVDKIAKGTPVRPRRWYDYVYPYEDDDLETTDLSHHYSTNMPFGIIDSRIVDLALRLQDDGDFAILYAFRRLEDIVRKRTGLTGEGANLFARAFMNEGAPLGWDVPDKAEVKGRASLFSAAYMAYRNARAHRQVDDNSDQEMREFLLVNELYRLEAESMTDAEMKAKRREDASFEDLLISLKNSRNDRL